MFSSYVFFSLPRRNHGVRNLFLRSQKLDIAVNTQECRKETTKLIAIEFSLLVVIPDDCKHTSSFFDVPVKEEY
jgi:hypothetical protein